MDNPETLATLGIKDTEQEQQQKTTKNKQINKQNKTKQNKNQHKTVN
jgi:hypothetical protein